MPLPTPLRFQPIEVLNPVVAATLPLSLQISSTPIFYKALVFRLLVGTIDIECNRTNKIIKPRNNYSVLGLGINRRVSRKLLEQVITPLTLLEYDTNIRATSTHHGKFYTEIFFEFSNYFFQKKNGNNIAAFVSLYRILERMAYCFPLFWAAKSKNYENTFTKLRSYFSDPKIGELGVFKKFVPDFIDLAFRNVHTTFNIQSSNVDWQSRYYQLLIGLLEATHIVNQVPNSQLLVQNEALVELTIKIRNQYFHALTGFSNSFSCEVMVDANEFFEIINESIAGWFAFILFQIFDFEIR